MVTDSTAPILFAIMELMPVLTLPAGAEKALYWLSDVIGFVNVFLPLGALVPIVALIIIIRNANIVAGIINLLVKIIPFW